MAERAWRKRSPDRSTDRSGGTVDRGRVNRAVSPGRRLVIGLADVGAGDADVAQEVVLAVEHVPVAVARLGAGQRSRTVAAARSAIVWIALRIPRSAAAVWVRVVMALVLRVAGRA